MKWMNTLGALICAGLVTAGCDQGSDQATSPAPAAAEAPAPEAPTEPAVPRLTTAEFRALIPGKSKQEIKAALGPPANVSAASSGGELWFYRPNVLQLYDEDAGIEIQGSSSILFSASGIATDVDY